MRKYMLAMKQAGYWPAGKILFGQDSRSAVLSAGMPPFVKRRR